MPKIGPVPVYLNDAQQKILEALNTDDVLTRNRLAEITGFSPTSGTIQAAIKGTRGARANLVKVGLVEVHELDLDGLTEVNYRLTDLGRQALQELKRQKEIKQ